MLAEPVQEIRIPGPKTTGAAQRSLLLKLGIRVVPKTQSPAQPPGRAGKPETQLTRAHRLMSMVFHILCERLEFGFLEQFTERALAIPIRCEVMAIMLTQVFDFRGGMLVVDLSALFAGAAIQAGILGGITHISSFGTR